MNLLPFIPGYTNTIYSSGRQTALVMFTAFLITFIFTRGYTRIARVRGWGSASFGGVHTHHLVFGLVIAFTAGALQFAFLPQENGIFQLVLAAMFGGGAALVLDEFALIFHLEDVYWEKEGRKSVDAVVIGSVFGILFLLQVSPFENTEGLPQLGFALVVTINLVFVIIAALKGKFFMSVLGVFIPLIAIIGSIRLAEPSSIWARKRYSKKGTKIKRSVKRYKEYEAKWRPRKEHLWDILGGKTGR